MNVLVEELGWSLAPGERACLDYLMTKNRPKWVCRGLVDLSTISNCSTPTPDKDDLLPHSQRRPGPDPHWKIPVTEWPAVLRRVEQGESLRTIAQEYTVSHAPL